MQHFLYYQPTEEVTMIDYTKRPRTVNVNHPRRPAQTLAPVVDATGVVRLTRGQSVRIA